MKLADKISIRLQQYVRGLNTGIVLPNYYCGFYEMDVMRLLPNGLLYEYEIKISRSDFKNDFKKGSKHSLMSHKQSICNRFFFVTPEGLIHPNEIPEYAGLITFSVYESGNVGFMNLVKNAKLIHKNRVSDTFYKDLAHKVSYREISWRRKLKEATELIKELKNKTNHPQ